jgi:hypothetical protein
MSRLIVRAVLGGLLAGLTASGCRVAPTWDAAAAGPHDHAWAPPQEALAAPASRPASEWEYTTSVYAWIASKNGVVETGNSTIALDDPDESTGLFLYLEGERGRWGFVADLDAISSTDRAGGPAGTIAVEEDTIIGELDVTYRPHENSTLQFLGGLRVLDSAQEIRFPILPDQELDTTQVDPVVGAQGTWTLGERVRFRLRGDIGGFGLDSDFTYQLVSLVGWEFARRWQLVGGYRILGYEFEDDGVRNDLRLSGILFGLAASF